MGRDRGLSRPLPGAGPLTGGAGRGSAPAATESADAVVVGAGIVGLATARALLARRPGWSVVVVDKEDHVGAHQSGHNSGVVHSGIYYPPGSAKARLCLEGRTELLAWCRERGLAHEVCGKVVVASTTDELARLQVLHERARGNGIEAELVGRRGLLDVEPHAEGLAALHVPSAAVVDYGEVCQALAAELEAGGAHLALGEPVVGLARDGSAVRVTTGRRAWRAGHAVNCGGLHSDRLAALAGDGGDERIVPFRGEYHDLVPERRALVRALVYPVPDPRFPFLGVHLTRGIDGRVHAGPNAVLALAREGYRWADVDGGDLRELAGLPALWSLARRYWRTGAAEVARSRSRRRLAAAASLLVPGLTADDLLPAGAGVRAQAVRPDGTLVDDFVFRGGGRLTHVVNAPSPAATASLAIGAEVARRVLGR